jgi:hypothetical protein
MRNMTITVPESVAVWARMWAAQHNSSVSRLVGELLTTRMNEETTYHAAEQAYLGRKPIRLRSSGTHYPARENLYER